MGLLRRRPSEADLFADFVASQQALMEIQAFIFPNLDTAARSMRAALVAEGVPLWPSMLPKVSP